MILDHPIGSQDVAADLAAKIDVEFGIFQLFVSRALLVHLKFVQPGTHLFQRTGTVLVLRALILALHYQSRRDVGHAHGGFGTVHVLAAGAAGSEHIHAQILRLDVDVDIVFDLGIGKNRRKGGVPARVCIEGRNSHQPVHADFGLQQAVRVFAVDLNRGGFYTGAFAFQPIGNYSLEAVPLSPAQIHAQQHLGPILALGAARAGMDDQNGIFRVVPAGQQHAGFENLQTLGELLQLALQFARHVFAFARQFEQRVQIGSYSGNFRLFGESLLQPLTILHNLLGLFGLIPEVGIGDLLFGFG